VLAGSDWPRCCCCRNNACIWMGIWNTAWRRVAWGVLLGLNVILALMVLGGVWSAYACLLYVFVDAQTLILLAPAVRHHVSPARHSYGST
jgi:hypothetical protein